MSMNEYQRVVCFALLPTSIAVAGFASTVCKLQSRVTNTPLIRIREIVLNAFSMQYQHNTWVCFNYIVNLIVFVMRNQHVEFQTQGSTAA